ncbi:MAG: hypothetical protein OER21_07920 [Gemmatimonadota bacterium]|nr:hypothetical protein [Gemmatimonadota bacterium]
MQARLYLAGVPDPTLVWMDGMEPLVDRRRLDRRARERRRSGETTATSDRRGGRDRRVRQRRETVSEHLRNALQVLVHLSTTRQLDAITAADVAAAVRRIWLALQEIERTGRRRQAS